MGILTKVIAGFAALAGAFILQTAGRIFAEEVKDWLPFFVHKLLNLAVNRLPGDQRERYREEWAADLDMFPGKLSQTIRAGGLYFAALRIHGLAPNSYRSSRNALRKSIRSSVSLFFSRAKIGFAVPVLRWTFLGLALLQFGISGFNFWGLFHSHWSFLHNLAYNVATLVFMTSLGKWLSGRQFVKNAQSRHLIKTLRRSLS